MWLATGVVPVQQPLAPLLLVLLFCVTGAAAPSGPVFPPCTPLRRPRPCDNCTVEDRDHVMQQCPMAPIIALEAAPGARDRVVAFHGDAQNGRFGNKLGAFFTARALALLGGYAVANCTALVYDGIHLPLWPPAAQGDGAVGGQGMHNESRYSDPAGRRLEELEHYCHRCPLSLVYPTLCPGMWLVGGVRQYLQWAFRRHARPPPPGDVAIQFRCGDSHDAVEMGLMSFHYYTAALEGRVNRSSRISVLPDPGATNSSCCMALALALVGALHHAFRCTVELLHPDHIGNDFAFFMRARVFVGSPSTFGLFAAMATHGEAFLPRCYTLMRNHTPCLDHVQWVAIPPYLHGCSESMFQWFVNSNSSPGVHSHLQQLIRGPWFQFSLRHYLHRKADAVIRSKQVQRVIQSEGAQRVIHRATGKASVRGGKGAS